MTIYLIKGILIGLILGVPVGAVGALTIQRTLKFGRRQGLLSGLGSSVADSIYACLGVFAINFIEGFMDRHKQIINIAGGILVICLGINMLLKKDSEEESNEEVSALKTLASSFAVGITNPTAALVFLFAFSYMNIEADAGILKGISLIAGVFVGTLVWWAVLITISQIIKKKAHPSILDRLNIIFGCVLIVFGAGVLVKTAI